MKSSVSTRKKDKKKKKNYQPSKNKKREKRKRTSYQANSGYIKSLSLPNQAGKLFSYILHQYYNPPYRDFFTHR